MRSLKALFCSVVAGLSVPLFAAASETEVERIVGEEIRKVLDSDFAGAAVAVRLQGRNLFFSYGWADSEKKRRVTPDSLFNLASVGKVFDTTLLSLAAVRGDVSLDDPIAKHVPELERGRDIRQVTLGQLATFTSGFTLPQDHPPWPPARYTWPRFLDRLVRWKRNPRYPPGEYVYSHAGFLLLHVGLERRFGRPYRAVLDEHVLAPLGLTSTVLPERGPDSVGLLPPTLLSRAVQGYSGEGEPIGKPGDVQGYYHWPGTAQMYSSARDLAHFVAVLLGEVPQEQALREAVALSHRPVATIRPGVRQAHAWEVHEGAETIIGKNGGLNNVTTYVGLIRAKRLGLVILMNRGELNAWEFAYPILMRVAELPE